MRVRSNEPLKNELVGQGMDGVRCKKFPTNKKRKDRMRREKEREEG